MADDLGDDWWETDNPAKADGIYCLQGKPNCRSF